MKRNIMKGTSILLACTMVLSMIGCANNAATVDEKNEATVEAELNQQANELKVETEDVQSTSEEETIMDNEQEILLTEKQRNSINMLNYLTVLVEEINESANSRMFLESAYSELHNNTEPSIVDDLTLDQYEKLFSIIEEYRMIAVKRERLQYLYEQSSADAIRNVMPNPLSVLNVVQSENPLKALVSVTYLALDSANSYQSSKKSLDLQYLKDGWALDDEESKQLYDSRNDMFAYMVRVSRELPKGLTLNSESVKEFVKWSNEENITSRIRWLESNRETYENYGEYWLILAESYYLKAESDGISYYEKCLNAVDKYEQLDNSIFRKDFRLAQTLPYAIVAAREILDDIEYTKLASKYAKLIEDNTKNSDWSLRYFAAQIYMDIYVKTNEKSYLEKAFELAYDNVNEQVSKQRSLNEDYLAEIKKQSTKDLDKKTKNEVKAYNELLEETREKELPPVYEPLRLNCDMLFGLAEELNISSQKRNDIDKILHPEGQILFLNPVMDNFYQMMSPKTDIDTSSIQVSYDKGKFEIPVMYVSDLTELVVTITDKKSQVEIDDWTIKKVKRNKSKDINDFVAIFESKDAKKIDYEDGAKISIMLKNRISEDSPLNVIEFQYEAKEKTYVWIIHLLSFERKK